ncbi:6251_t:CDS:2 [Funneliformis caledonium]|uniref:6251_t:CDS:1 n=1 Tax=Funneliformis caledonium TaxID=1117310 RepID=A0A9N9BWE9_9GLOM|nr:6251_t:CDS:2 [Funneliformis caledonium]
MDDYKINDTLKELKSKNSKLKKPLENRHEEQEYIFENMTKGFENEDIEGCKSNLEQLKDNSKHIREMMKQQNEYIQTSITIAEKTLNILNEAKTLSCLMDYITDFIDIIVDELTQELKYDITIEEFELLMRFKRKSNVEFHNDDDAKKLPESIPEISKEFKVPLIKVLNALE